MTEISERHEVRVQGRDKSFVFLAESDEGRLVIREERGDGEEVCGLSLADPEELAGFFEGLRRVLGAVKASAPRGDGGSLDALRSALSPGAAGAAEKAPEPPPPARRGDTDPEPDHDEMVAQARQKNPNAFKSWSREEEAEVKARFERGESIEKIAREHQRSPRAIQMRIEKLGVAAQTRR